MTFEQPTRPPTEHVNVLELVWRNKLRLALLSILSACAGLMAALHFSPVYNSYATIRIEEETTASPTISLPGFTNTNVAQTEAQLITSKAVLDPVIDQLALRNVVALPGTPLSCSLPFFRSRQGSKCTSPTASTLSLELLSVPAAWMNKQLLVSYNDGDLFTVSLPDGRVLEGTAGNIVRDPNVAFAILIDTLSAPPGTQFLIEKRSQTGALEDLRSALDINVQGTTGLIDLSLSNTIPDNSLQTLNAVVSVYKAYNEQYAVNIAQKRLDYIEDEISPALQAVRNAEEDLVQYQKNNSTLGLQIQVEHLSRRLAETEDLLRNAQIPKERQRLRELRDEIMDDLRRLPDEQIDLENLARNIDITQRIYVELVKLVQELRLQRVSAEGTASIIDAAWLDERPDNSTAKLLFVFIWISGTAIGGLTTILLANRTRLRYSRVSK